MKSIAICSTKYPDIHKIPLSVCQECKLRKFPENDDRKCAWGTDYLKSENYDC